MEFLAIGVVFGVAFTAYLNRHRLPVYVTLLEVLIVVAMIAAIAAITPPVPIRGDELPGGVSVISASPESTLLTFLELGRSFLTKSQRFLIGAVYFVAMLLGMCGEYMFRLKKWSEFELAEFVRPFWVSFIVFGIPWSTVDKAAVSLSSVILCYQNGFFWKLVLERIGKP